MKVTSNYSKLCMFQVKIKYKGEGKSCTWDHVDICGSGG